MFASVSNRFKLLLILVAVSGCDCDDASVCCLSDEQTFSIEKTSACKEGVAKEVSACQVICCNVRGEFRRIPAGLCQNVTPVADMLCSGSPDASAPSDSGPVDTNMSTVDSGTGTDTGVSSDGGAGADSTISGQTCTCEGADRFTKDAACPSNFTDATQCSGFVSVAISQRGMAFTPDSEAAVRTESFADGTEFCGFGCCITIHCP